MTSRLRISGIILKNINYGEKDRIATILSAELGLFTAIMRGAAGSRKRYGGFLEIFSTVSADVAPGEGLRMCKILRADLMNPRGAIAADLSKISCASVICEAAASFFREGQGKGRAFSILEAALDSINDAGTDFSNIFMCAYLVKTLKLCGFLPQPKCSSCGSRSSKELGLAVHHAQFVCLNCAKRLHACAVMEYGEEVFELLEILLMARFADIVKSEASGGAAASGLVRLLKFLTADILGHEIKSFSWVEG
ncbi:MAG: DNA repair protein RecO [Deltaproteobacteria bacterium]|nr:DNA repair protein RecO [Deltaproteobacteria bacterium]